MMGRKKVAIPIRSQVFRVAVDAEGKTADVCKKIGVTRQMLHTWICGGEIPPRRLSDMAKIFNWDSEMIKAICDEDKSLTFWKNRARKAEEEVVRLRNALHELVKAT